MSPLVSGPLLILNVQMSLYDTSLAAYIGLDQPTFSSNPELHHCFHPCITLELLLHILSGVEYLHGNGVVHRDLKPANIFLSLSTARKPPAGSVNLYTCHKCPTQTDSKSQNTFCIALQPRVGDFGLVAALGLPTTGTEAVTTSKPVGTEFYRPPNGGSMSEKLDVFALGIMAFEMLNKFNTKSERAMTLMQVRRGEFPAGFVETFGECGEKVKALLAGMLHADEHERWGCDQVRREIEELVKALKG
jgi:translation initiation factor 2-alpha kinase 3